MNGEMKFRTRSAYLRVSLSFKVLEVIVGGLKSRNGTLDKEARLFTMSGIFRKCGTFSSKIISNLCHLKFVHFL